MPLELIVVSVSRRGDGTSLIGFGAVVPGQYGFIRLVAPTPDGLLYPERHRIDDTAEPRPWDLLQVEAPWSDARPSQPENRVVDDSPWKLLERPASRPHLTRLEQAPLTAGALFGTLGRAVRADGGNLQPSILYVEPEWVEAICYWDSQRERYRARLRFASGGVNHDLPLTDAHYSRILLRRGEGTFTLPQLGCRAPHGLRLVVTLGEPFHGWRYKLVAGILPRRTSKLFRDAATPSLPAQDRNPTYYPVEPARALVAGA